MGQEPGRGWIKSSMAAGGRQWQRPLTGGAAAAGWKRGGYNPSGCSIVPATPANFAASFSQGDLGRVLSERKFWRRAPPSGPQALQHDAA